MSSCHNPGNPRAHSREVKGGFTLKQKAECPGNTGPPTAGGTSQR